MERERLIFRSDLVWRRVARACAWSSSRRRNWSVNSRRSRSNTRSIGSFARYAFTPRSTIVRQRKYRALRTMSVARWDFNFRHCRSHGLGPSMMSLDTASEYRFLGLLRTSRIAHWSEFNLGQLSIGV